MISSADPTKTALTVKGFLSTATGVVLMVSPLFHLHLGQSQLDEIVEALVQGLILTLTIVSSIAGILGLIRKVILSLQSK